MRSRDVSKWAYLYVSTDPMLFCSKTFGGQWKIVFYAKYLVIWYRGCFCFLTCRGFLFRFVAQRNKMRHNEMRPCHVTQGCVHTVKKIMERFWYRVGQCKMGISGLPDKLPIMPEKETPSDEEWVTLQRGGQIDSWLELAYEQILTTRAQRLQETPDRDHCMGVGLIHLSIAACLFTIVRRAHREVDYSNFRCHWMWFWRARLHLGNLELDLIVIKFIVH